MLRSLSSVIRDWKPRREDPIDPMVAIVGAWGSIVGEDVAFNARPHRLERGTLHITTTSSAWSQQLAFLEPHILKALRELSQTSTVEKLRFRIGRLQPFLTHQQTFSEALPRRRQFSRTSCVGCGVSLESGTRCAPCAHGLREIRLLQVRRIMFEEPHLRYEEISERLGGLRRYDYEEVRRGLLHRWWEILERAERTGKLRADGYERRIAHSYLLLKSGLGVENISQATARNLLGTRLEKLLFGSTSSDTPSSKE